MRRILIAYATNTGTTEDLAEIIGDTLRGQGVEVDVLNIKQVRDLTEYSGIVIGAPVIFGWHSDAMQFLKRHREGLKSKPVALFLVSMSLTEPDVLEVDGVPIAADPKLATPPKNPGKPTFKERYATIGNYLRPVLNAAPQIHPIQAAFFRGRLDFSKLNIFQILFVLLVIQAQPGGSLNRPFIAEWAEELKKKLKAE